MVGEDQEPDGPIDRLNHLFQTVRRPDGRFWSDRAAAKALSDSGHLISHTQIGHIRAGRREPRFVDMVAFAELFGRDPSYFTETAPRPSSSRSSADAFASGARLAEKIELLFTAVHPADRGPYTEQEVASGIDRCGGQVSETDIRQLRTAGCLADATHLEALAAFFDVDSAYFDLVRGGDIERDLRAIVAMRDLQVRRIAARVCGLSDASLEAVAQIVEQVVTALESQPDAQRTINRPPYS
ncbi:MAG: hypothetical protein JXA67_13100 [Micromonosporaceae bacterium]|nr:hypothetical protein [Micromonosporaceae bacterium]